MSHTFTFDQETLNAKLEHAKQWYLARHGVIVKSYPTVHAMLTDFQELIAQGYKLTTGYIAQGTLGNYTAGFDVPPELLEAGLEQVAAKTTEEYQQELEAAKQAHIEAQVAAALEAHEAAEAAKAETKRQRIADTARRAALAALGDAA